MENSTRQIENPLLHKIIQDELAGKYAGIHAYDKYMWTVRSGYLTLVFGAWGFFVKAAMESENISLVPVLQYIIVLAIVTIMLSIGAFFIDRNYCRRKFRIINAVNEFMKLVISKTFSLSDEGILGKLTGLLQISGDASNDSYKCPAYHNEVSVGFVIFMLPMISALIALIYMLFIF
jgi:hypothetical protein